MRLAGEVGNEFEIGVVVKHGELAGFGHGRNQCINKR